MGSLQETVSWGRELWVHTRRAVRAPVRPKDPGRSSTSTGTGGVPVNPSTTSAKGRGCQEMGSKPHQHNFPTVQNSLDQHRASWMTPSGNAVERMSALGGGGRHDLPTSRPALGFQAPGWSQGRKGVGWDQSSLRRAGGGGSAEEARQGQSAGLHPVPACPSHPQS